MASTSPRTALVAGASGLVGGHLTRLLLRHPAYGRVVTIGRRGMPTPNPKHTHHVVNFDQLEDARDRLAADDVFCALGTTIKQAGSKPAFERVELEYVRALARQSRLAGARQFVLVSSYGANPSALAFYSRVKGEAERAVAVEPFAGIYIARPPLLLGERDEDRPGERAAEVVLGALAPILRGPLADLRPIQAEVLARALVGIAANGLGGVRVYPPRLLHRLGRPDADVRSDEALLGVERSRR
jgi:uncharacterized protein YbjT (DUF2867 family)